MLREATTYALRYAPRANKCINSISVNPPDFVLGTSRYDQKNPYHDLVNSTTSSSYIHKILFYITSKVMEKVLT